MPKFVMPGVYQLADSGYAGKHRFFLDGTPEFLDVFDASAGTWKTILVGGANSGARGYYAVDITDPASPKGLWEFCSDATLCAVNDPDLGLTYGNPVIGKRISDGRWVVVVTSGLNNATPGNGGGFFYVLDAITGALLHKVGTGVGDTTTPSGLMKIGGYYPDGFIDATFTHVYGGDQLGNVWRIDMSTSPPALMHLATLKDPTGRAQPLTARPVASPITVSGIAKRVYYVGTGRYLGNADLADPGAASGIAWQQSIYGIMDKDTDLGNISSLSPNLVKQTLSAFSPTQRAITKDPVDWSVKDGFVIDLLPNIDVIPTEGERIVLDLHLVLGTLVITSTIPIKGGCSPGGNSFQYNLDYRTGGYVRGAANGVAGYNLGRFVVGTAIAQTTDGSIKAINKDFSGGNDPTSVNIDPTTAFKRFSYRER
jgi:type IV pilus assembly protein PilY1